MTASLCALHETCANYHVHVWCTCVRRVSLRVPVWPYLYVCGPRGGRGATSMACCLLPLIYRLLVTVHAPQRLLRFGSERWPLSFCSPPRCCGTETSNEERPPPPGPSTPSPPEIPPTSRCLYCTGGEACHDPFLQPTLLSTTKSSMSTTGELSVPGGEVRDATAPKPPFNPPGTRFRLVRPDPQRAERLCSSSPRSGPAACQTADRWHPRLAPP